MQERQVIVVGSGPAGASCAKALTDRGVDVLVLEKDPLPRYKCCSGILFGQTLELLDRYYGEQAPDAVRCSPEILNAEDIRNWNKDGSSAPYCYEIAKDGHEFPSDYINIWRNLFDKWLLDSSGSEYRDCSRVKHFKTSTDHVTVTVDQTDPAGNKKTLDYRCQYLVGADGWNSSVKRLIYPESSAMSTAQGCLQRYFKIESRGSLPVGFAVFFIPETGKVLSAAYEKDGYLLLCVGGTRGTKLRDSLEAFRKFLMDKYHVRLGEPWRDESCQMVFALPVLGEDRVLLTGEAANFMYLNGEGISVAIDSGYRCGQAIAQGLGEHINPLPGYAESIQDIVAHMQRCFAQH